MKMKLCFGTLASGIVWVCVARAQDPQLIQAAR